ncbi:hypothetical protein DC366_00855 [Pelagivirga sediminicola]|uniref:Uncharacterized protein n=2 Tax=Pelagivirga sediminicola TaxID=2170575 RepID=A0A2T7GAW8_9RHOB|nr:hypothetical protein DC366_00855 [Pelagivirga sediminicola]
MNVNLNIQNPTAAPALNAGLSVVEFARLKAADNRATAHLHPKHAAKLKAKRKARWPRPCVDEDGTACYLVPLSDTRPAFAIVEVADYWKARDGGADGLWSAMGTSRHYSYVTSNARMRSKVPGTTLYPARLILDAAAGERVGFVNGDTYDLRRKNLEIIKART